MPRPEATLDNRRIRRKIGGMILVTGGTGFVGREVVNTLLASGYQIRLLVRDPARAIAWSHHPRVQIVRGDALQPETLPSAMTGVQTVVQLIGIIAETSRVTFAQAHTEATRNLLAAATKAGATRWLQMSAIGTRPLAVSRYHQTKWEAEELVRQSELDWTIFRPSLIYGYDRHDRLLRILSLALSPPVTWLSLASFPLLDGGKNLVQPVGVREVAHAFARAVATPASIGQTLDLVGPVAFSWREMIARIAAHLDRESVYQGIPGWLILRELGVLAALLLPVLIVAGVVTARLPLPLALAGIGLWFVLLFVLRQIRQIVIFSFPSTPLLSLGRLLDGPAPRWMQFGEQLKMALEDNIGDPHPAAELFSYNPETFDQALKNRR